MFHSFACFKTAWISSVWYFSIPLSAFVKGAIETATLETRIKVSDPEDPEPSINLYVENQEDPAMRLVSEMMILCGEAIATFGSLNHIPLPYRGQPQSGMDLSVFAHLPEGPVRSFALVKVMRAAEIDFRNPTRHGVLGVPGYVQFTSPIRRYLDLLAHYQVCFFHFYNYNCCKNMPVMKLFMTSASKNKEIERS